MKKTLCALLAAGMVSFGACTPPKSRRADYANNAYFTQKPEDQKELAYSNIETILVDNGWTINKQHFSKTTSTCGMHSVTTSRWSNSQRKMVESSRMECAHEYRSITQGAFFDQINSVELDGDGVEVNGSVSISTKDRRQATDLASALQIYTSPAGLSYVPIVVADKGNKMDPDMGEKVWLGGMMSLGMGVLSLGLGAVAEQHNDILYGVGGVGVALGLVLIPFSYNMD